jgi:RNA polymerase sigma factor (sigma-70 family)
MATANLSALLRDLTRGMAAQMLVGDSDHQLVERALARHDDAALQAIVHRHGPMVYRVCWRVLQHSQDAEDAFQATFLLLAQKLRTLRQHASLASWLHGVARRVALKAKAQAASRRRHEQHASMPDTLPPDDVTWREVRSALDFELSRLPDKWRLPLILCYLEGRTQDEAASHLGWSKSTLRRRLREARDALGRRLSGRGLVGSAGLAAVLVSDCTASAAPAPGLLASTAKAAAGVAAGKTVATAASARVAVLTEGMLKVMLITKLKNATVVLVVIALIVGGVTGVAMQAPQDVATNQVETKKVADPDLEKSDRRSSKKNLKQLMLGMHAYYHVNAHFPPAALYDANGKALLSWRVLLLPYLNEDDLFEQFKLDEPWDSKHNKKLLAKMPKEFAPVRGKTKEPYSTFYQVFTGKGAGFEGTQGLSAKDITDGTSLTIAIVEAAKAVPWSKPVDLAYFPDKPLPKLGSMFRDVFLAAFFDGTVHTLNRKFDEKTMRQVITRSGGENPDLKKIEADQ